jgi:hypothetical protein
MPNQYTDAPARTWLPLTERFWSKVDRNGPVPTHVPHLGPCWIWTSATNWGYGLITVNRRTRRAHHIAWELTSGPIPSGLWVLHKCDNRPCVRPDHLFVGTRRNNIDDMVNKGRVPKGASHYARLKPELLPIGERHSQSKLTAEQVREIRALYAAGGVTHADLAVRYGVSRKSIGDIVNRKYWLHT